MYRFRAEGGVMLFLSSRTCRRTRGFWRLSGFQSGVELVHEGVGCSGKERVYLAQIFRSFLFKNAAVFDGL